MADEYIRRVEAEEAIEEYCCRRCKEYSEVEGGCVSHAQHCEHLSGEEILKPVKSVDVQPVKHGRWIDIYEYCEKNGYIPSGIGIYYWCSECEKAEPKISDYCPNCGARMDGGNEDENSI